jgi:hypothetical protein
MLDLERRSAIQWVESVERHSPLAPLRTAGG